MNFQCRNENKKNNLNKCYQEYNLEQCSRSFNHRTSRVDKKRISFLKNNIQFFLFKIYF